MTEDPKWKVGLALMIGVLIVNAIMIVPITLAMCVHYVLFSTGMDVPIIAIGILCIFFTFYNRK